MGEPATDPGDGRPKSVEREGIPRPPSGFTAVNGRTSPPSRDPQTERETSDPNRSRPTPPKSTSSVSPTEQHHHREGGRQVNGIEPQSAGAPPPPPPPKSRSPPNPSLNHPSFAADRPRQHVNGGPPNHDQMPTQNGVTSPPKRKRSLSPRERPTPNGPVYPSTAPPQSPGASRTSVDGGSARDRDPYGRPGYSPSREPQRETYLPTPTDGYPPPPNDGYHSSHRHAYPPPPAPQDHSPASEVYSRQERHPPQRAEYEQPVDPSIAPGSRPYYSDAHIAEALQRENRNYDNNVARASYGTTEEEDGDQQGQYGEYGSTRDQQSAEIERRKRKRVFSNRTKTGCMTCRRRKKKCDEQHPECNNCLRGGFVCEGYSVRNTWQKPANSKQPIPLQSKNGYPAHPPPPQGRPSYGGNPYDAGPEYTSPHTRAPPYDALRPDYHAHGEEDRDRGYNRPDPKQNHYMSSSSSRPYSSNPPQASEYKGDYNPKNEHRGSIYEMSQENDSHSMPPPQPDSRNGASQYQPHTRTPPSHNAQAAAQAALTHTNAMRPLSSRGRDDRIRDDRGKEEFMTERDRMLKGSYYTPHTPALIADREACIQAIWRFNNATNPSHGVSPEERIRLFRAILSLRPTPEPPLPNGEPGPSSSIPLPMGSVGDRVVVEAPFHCDYGYNITIGDDVLIGADCRISDTCHVSIGARCIFSPNVKLICATYPIDPRRRSGSRGPALGRNIVIEEDCWIGANVTILAGVRVGKSSTVGAGSLLHQDVPRFTVVAGNPAKVSRGIYDDSN